MFEVLIFMPRNCYLKLHISWYFFVGRLNFLIGTTIHVWSGCAQIAMLRMAGMLVIPINSRCWWGHILHVNNAFRSHGYDLEAVTNTMTDVDVVAVFADHPEIDVDLFSIRFRRIRDSQAIRGWMISCSDVPVDLFVSSGMWGVCWTLCTVSLRYPFPNSNEWCTACSSLNSGSEWGKRRAARKWKW